MNKGAVRLLVIVLIILGIATIGIVWKSWASSSVLLSEEEVVQMVLEQYPGEVVSISLEHDAYVIQVQLVKGLYELRVNADEGTIISIRRLKNIVPDTIAPDKEPPDIKLPDKEPKDKEPTDKEPSIKEPPIKVPIQEPDVAEPIKKPISDVDKGSTTLVTRDNAAVLSLKHVPGTVDNIELRGKDISSYYLVKINTPDRREAVVQVNGISGAIMSVTWQDKIDVIKDVKEEDGKNKVDNKEKVNMNEKNDKVDNNNKVINKEKVNNNDKVDNIDKVDMTEKNNMRNKNDKDNVNGKDKNVNP